jgi:hypothetical protein
MADESAIRNGATALKIFGSGSLFDFLGDAVAYRSLTPADRSLPGLTELRRQLGLAENGVPRKIEPAYGRVVSEILRAAGRQQADPVDLEAVVLLGDTEHNDGGAFTSICKALGCPGGAFICDERGDLPSIESPGGGDRGPIYLANRWRLIEDFEAGLAAGGMHIGRGTAVIIDIDKTALGARGRNDRPIDEARGAAVLRTAQGLRGDAVDRGRLMAIYEHFNHPRFHAFTTDNQDYLAYVAMVVESGWTTVEALDREISGGRLASFFDLLSSISASIDDLDGDLRPVHMEVVAAVAAGDPTPFKDFRRAEFQETVARMKPTETADGTEPLLESRLTITYEIRRKALEWRDRGALLFGLSDKPDEASFPTAEMAAEGYLPLHRTTALVVGEDRD